MLAAAEEGIQHGADVAKQNAETEASGRPSTLAAETESDRIEACVPIGWFLQYWILYYGSYRFMQNDRYDMI